MRHSFNKMVFFILFLMFIIPIISINAHMQSSINNTNKNWIISDGISNNAHYNVTYESGQISFLQLPLWIQVFSISAILISLITIFIMLPPFFGRLKNVLDNEKRQAILTYIMENPGCTIADISDTQKINRGTVKYHIFQLELSGKVFTKHEDKFARLFHKTSEFKDMERVITPYLRNDTSKAILLVIMDSPGITNQDLSSKFNLDKSTVHWYLQKFNHDGIINFVKDGKFRKCFMKTEAKMVLLRFMPA